MKDGRSVGRARCGVLAAPGSRRRPRLGAFALSYDLGGTIRRDCGRCACPVRLHLMAAAAEAWCVEQLAVPVSALGALGRDLPFWIRLEYRLLDADAAQDPSDSGYSLQALIDAFSRRRKTESSMHALEAGPFRLPPRGSPSTPSIR